MCNISSALYTAQFYLPLSFILRNQRTIITAFSMKKSYDGKRQVIIIFPEGQGGGKGVRNHVVVSTLCREATLRNRWFPLLKF